MFTETSPTHPRRPASSEPLSGVPFHDGLAANETGSRCPIARGRSAAPRPSHFNPAQLRLARHLRSLSADELAKKAGCSSAEIHAFENGVRGPSHATLRRLRLL